MLTNILCKKHSRSPILNSALLIPNYKVFSIFKFFVSKNNSCKNYRKSHFQIFKEKLDYNFKKFSTYRNCNDKRSKLKFDYRKLFGIGIVFCLGQLLINRKAFNINELNLRFEHFNEWSYNWVLNNLINKFAPSPKEPLLPDHEQLGYPENLPTLVIGLSGVVCDISHTRKNGWGIVKRPGADKFFEELKHYYEIVIWSNESFPVPQEIVQKWNLPVIGVLDQSLFSKKDGRYFKNLSRLGRNLNRVILIDNNSESSLLQPDNSIVLNKFEGNLYDNELESIIDLLKTAALQSGDIRKFLQKFREDDLNIVDKFKEHKKTIIDKSNNRRKFSKFLPK